MYLYIYIFTHVYLHMCKYTFKYIHIYIVNIRRFICKFLKFYLLLAALGLSCCLGFSLVAARGGYSLWCAGFSLQWLLWLQSRVSRMRAQ